MAIKKVIGYMVTEKERENFYGQKILGMVIFMMVDGKMIKDMEKENMNTLMVIYMRVNGKMEKKLENGNLLKKVNILKI